MKPHEELLEIRRKTVHLITGALVAALAWTRFFDSVLMLSITFFLIGFFLLVKEFHLKMPLLFRVLRLFEREKHIRSFPGKSVIFFFVGCTLSVVLFPRDIAVASILILAFGDSLSNLVGHHFGRIATPFHAIKKIEGPIVAALVSAGIASFFVPFFPVLVASFGAMLLEIPEWKIFGKHIDDNLIIPLVSGTILLFLT
jgi:dolichol kinase